MMCIVRNLADAGSPVSILKCLCFHVENLRRTKRAPTVHQRVRNRLSKVEPTDGQIGTYRFDLGMRTGEGGIRIAGNRNSRPKLGLQVETVVQQEVVIIHVVAAVVTDSHEYSCTLAHCANPF